MNKRKVLTAKSVAQLKRHFIDNENELIEVRTTREVANELLLENESFDWKGEAYGFIVYSVGLDVYGVVSSREQCTRLSEDGGQIIPKGINDYPNN